MALVHISKKTKKDTHFYSPFMKLHSFEHKNNYTFILGFADHSFIEADLSPLLKAYVEPSAINTAKIDSEWGCLIFNDGMVDIEPRTLYKFAVEQGVYHPDKKDTHF